MKYSFISKRHYKIKGKKKNFKTVLASVKEYL